LIEFFRSGFRCQTSGSKVQRSKVKRLNNRKSGHIGALKLLNPEPLNPEPETCLPSITFKMKEGNLKLDDAQYAKPL
jgi:hypothetical protein